MKVRGGSTGLNYPDLAGHGVFVNRSVGWFNCTEPSLTTALQGQQHVQGARPLVRGGSSAHNELRQCINHNKLW